MRRGTTLLETIIIILSSVIVVSLLFFSTLTLLNLKSNSLAYIKINNEYLVFINDFKSLVEDYNGKNIVIKNNEMFCDNERIFYSENNKQIYLYIDDIKKESKKRFDYILTAINGHLLKFEVFLENDSECMYFFIGGLINED